MIYEDEVEIFINSVFEVINCDESKMLMNPDKKGLEMCSIFEFSKVILENLDMMNYPEISLKVESDIVIFDPNEVLRSYEFDSKLI